MPPGGLDEHAVCRAAVLCRPELSDELEVLRIVDVHLAVVVVFELLVIELFLWDLLASEAPDSLNL